MARMTRAQKTRLLRYLIERDGFKCYLCGEAFKNVKEPVLEHLNDNWNDNREDNLGLAHQSCNIKKASDRDFKLKAANKLEYNETHLDVGESFFDKKDSKEGESSTEIEINKKCYDIAEMYLADKISKEGFIPYKGLIHNIVYLCKQKTSHGSEQSIRSHLQTLTSELAPYEITRDDKGKRIVKKRSIPNLFLFFVLIIVIYDVI